MPHCSALPSPPCRKHDESPACLLPVHYIPSRVAHTQQSLLPVPLSHPPIPAPHIPPPLKKTTVRALIHQIPLSHNKTTGRPRPRPRKGPQGTNAPTSRGLTRRPPLHPAAPADVWTGRSDGQRRGRGHARGSMYVCMYVYYTNVDMLGLELGLCACLLCGVCA